MTHALAYLMLALWVAAPLTAAALIRWVGPRYGVRGLMTLAAGILLLVAGTAAVSTGFVPDYSYYRDPIPAAENAFLTALIFSCIYVLPTWMTLTPYIVLDSSSLEFRRILAGVLGYTGVVVGAWLGIGISFDTFGK